MNTRTPPTASPAAAAVRRVEVSGELKELMRRLKLGRLLDTLPERGTPCPNEVLVMLLADEVSRRDRHAIDRRAREANLDPSMALEAWDDSSAGSTERCGPNCAHCGSWAPRTMC